MKKFKALSTYIHKSLGSLFGGIGKVCNVCKSILIWYITVLGRQPTNEGMMWWWREGGAYLEREEYGSRGVELNTLVCNGLKFKQSLQRISLMT